MVAALDEATNLTYTQILKMPYEKTLRLNLDLRAHAEEKQKMIEKARQNGHHS